MGDTLKACREHAKAVYNRTSNSYIAATIPYVVYKHKRFGLDVYDATIPNEIKRGLGVEVRLILQESSE